MDTDALSSLLGSGAFVKSINCTITKTRHKENIEATGTERKVVLRDAILLPIISQARV